MSDEKHSSFEPVERTVGPKPIPVVKQGSASRRSETKASSKPNVSNLGLLLVAVAASAVWGGWVTKNIVDPPSSAPFVRVELSRIVGDYVQAQARSATSPEMIAAETKQFMSVVEEELNKQSSAGKIVLVNEAVVSTNVPNITEELREAVYKRVKMPQVANVSRSNVMASMQEAMGNAPIVTPSGGANGQ